MTAACCEPAGPATPEEAFNRPALVSIAYRVGTYASFRRAMLQAISRHRRPGDAPGQPATRPLAGWTTRSPDDFGIAFVEMWAYLADVLTFYQERIANEAYLRTAVQPESVAALAALLGYRPSPGRAAAADLVMEAERQATVRLDSGLLVQSVPGQDERPQKFETIEAVEAHASLNRLRPVSTEAQRLLRGATRAVIEGVGHGVGPGDWVAVVGRERRTDPVSERWDVRRLASVDEDADAGTTTLAWTEGLGAPPRPGRAAINPSADPEVWVFRAQAWPFGANAPDDRLVPDDLGLGVATWNDKFLPEDTARPEHVYLDTLYPDVVPGGWVALVTAEIDARTHPELRGFEGYVELYPVLETADTTRVNYTLAARVTRVTVDVAADGSPTHIGYFPMRGTSILVQSERLPLARVPLGHSSAGPGADAPHPVAGDVVALEGLHPDIHRGRRLVVLGALADGSGTGTEAVEVESVAHDPAAGTTTLSLTKPLANAYVPSAAVLHGNVARATHGERVAGEVLGDGDAARPFQAFDVAGAPVTFVSRPGAPGGVASTLEVRVDGVRWDEVPELYGQPGDARVHTARRQPDETLEVQFGDGVTGARPVSGRRNVTATYRVGLGPDGNVPAGSLRTLLEKPLGLKRATNPAPAAGGAAAESPDAVKENAPGTVRTFGRIVSLRDFEDAAREYVGIAKAAASWTWDGEQRVVELVVAADGGAVAEPLLVELRADLDARRDPYQPLAVREFTRRPVTVALTVVVDGAYVAEDVQAGSDAALRGLFAFDALDLGRSVHLSDVYAAIQAVAGVVAVDVDVFRFKWEPDRRGRGGGDLVVPRLLIGPGDLAWVDDVDDLRVTGTRPETRR